MPELFNNSCETSLSENANYANHNFSRKEFEFLSKCSKFKFNQIEAEIFDVELRIKELKRILDEKQKEIAICDKCARFDNYVSLPDEFKKEFRSVFIKNRHDLRYLIDLAKLA